MLTINEILAQELGQKQEYVDNVVRLIDEGNTIPFIARYRKELHGAMDDTTLRNLETRLTYLRNLQDRRDEVKKSIENQGKLTDELSAAIDAAATMTEVEDLYRPYKQKRRTRGSIAREKGLEPLAQAIFTQDGSDPSELAQGYVDPEKGVNTVEEALQGANDIIAENLSDDADIRKALRELVMRRGIFTCKAADGAEEDGVYKLYYDFSQPIQRMLDHQILAINRGEKEDVLKPNVTLVGNEGAALVCRAALKPTMNVSAFVRAAAPRTVGVVLNTNTKKGNVILGDKYRTLWGQDYLMDTLCGLRFKLSVPSFYQVNRDQAEVLYGKALEFAGLTGEETVLDLYCGTGTITLCMAGKAKKVIGAEIVPAAIRDAEENAVRNHIGNAEFFCGDAADIAAKLEKDGLRPDVITVDPPRKGLAPEVIASVAAMGPERVVYVSCDPATLGRDVKLFAELGYRAIRACAVDMFPGTRHVETVAQLVRMK